MTDRIAQIRANVETAYREKPGEQELIVNPDWKPGPPPAPVNPDLIPDLSDLDRGSPVDDGLDDFLNSKSVLDFYRRYCGKMEPKVGSRRESIMVSCPKPEHGDKNPSAWLNIDKDTWFCGGCQEGGDKYDIAAYGLNYPVPGYKEKFGDLRRSIAMDHGFAVITTGTTERIVDDPEPEPEPEKPSADVIELHPDPDGDDENHDAFDPYNDEEPIERFPILELHSVLPQNSSFLDHWVGEHRDIAPDILNLWAGLTAISAAVGRGYYLDDTRPAYANIFVVLIAPTGAGKSAAIGPVTQLIDNCFPYDAGDPNSIDIDTIDGPASGEAMVNKLDVEREIGINSIGLPDMEKVPKRALVTYDEFGVLAKKAAIQNSSLREVLQQLSDVRRTVGYSTKDHSRSAHDAYVSLISGTQPRVLRDYLDQSDVFSGFANRFFFAREGQEWKERGYRSGHSPNTIQASRKIKEIRTKYENFAIPLADDAIDQHNEFVQLCAGWAADGDPMLARMSLKLKKLEILLAANQLLDEVTLDIVYQAMVIMMWLHDCATSTSKDLSGGRENDCSEAIITAIQWASAPSRRGKATYNTIKGRITRRKSNNYADSELLRVLKILTEVNVLGKATTKRGLDYWFILDEEDATIWTLSDDKE